MIKNPLFYAKILLFGEYGIIQDAMGLSIPYNYYNGQLISSELDTEQKIASNNSLKRFYEYLNTQRESNLEFPLLNLDALKSDIDKGLTFDSSIPQGFGVGSSGALVAAIYDQYAQNKIEPEKNIQKADILELKKNFSLMESFFHGKSSGLDPLICYLKLPMLIKSSSDVATIGLPLENKLGKGAIFLIDSGAPGETQPMVNLFMEKMKQEGFRKVVSEQFKKYNDECINAFLNHDLKPLFKSIKKLSNVVLKHFTPMIPVSFHSLWKEGIKTNTYYLKLCGSGGGGYILGFAPDFDKALPLLKDYKPEVIYTF